jgi:hypothetical protein
MRIKNLYTQFSWAGQTAVCALVVLTTDALLLCGLESNLFGQDKTKPGIAPLLYSGNEAGSFKILFGGVEIGQEKFQIVEESNVVKASAETRLTIERDHEKIVFVIRPVLQFSRFFEPINYQVVQEAGPNKTKAQVNFKTGMTEAIYDTGKESDAREIQLKKDVLVLDDNVFHQYIILLKRYDFTKGGIQEFSAFVPQQFIAGGVSVADQGIESVQVGNKNLKLQHLLVDTGELKISLWVNEKHELAKLSVPQSNVEVVRE